MDQFTVPETAIYTIAAIALVFVIAFGRQIVKACFLLIRAVIQPFSPLFRLLGRILRPFAKLIRRVGGPTSQAAAGGGGMSGASSFWPALMQFLEMSSFTDEALKDAPQWVIDSTKKDRIGFKSLDISVPKDHSATLDFELAQKNAEYAKSFYSSRVRLAPFHLTSLYEDVDAAFIIRTFRDSDFFLFFAVKKMHKVVRRNVRRLIVAMTVLPFLIPFGMEIARSLVGSESNLLNFIFGAICLFILIIMLVVKYMYGETQHTNGMRLNTFLQNYTQTLSRQYESAKGSLLQDTTNQRLEPKEIGDRAQIWYTNIHWIALRALFIRLYVRNIVYQIKRDSFWIRFILLIFIPAEILMVANLGNMSVLFNQLFTALTVPVVVTDTGSLPTWIQYSTLGLLAFGWLLVLRPLTRFDPELREYDWPNFQSFGLLDNMQEIIANDKSEIVEQRRRRI